MVKSMSMNEGEVQVSAAGAERIPTLEPLWAAMHEHHSAMQDAVAPTRPVEESWRLRKAQYEEWLSSDDALLLIAERGGDPIGYAVVRFGPGAATWDIGERVAEIESLSVATDARGSGIGTLLMDAVRAATRDRGAERLFVGVAHANSGALRFYEREGFAPFYVLLMEASDRPEGGP
jgi:ribosomal protein S18 acetylase RimI-like enzyme